MSYYFTRRIGAAAVLATLLAGPAAAFSIPSPTASSPNAPIVQDARWVCNQWGRCYHERSYGYYRHYYSEPSYGYSEGPSFSFSFGRHPRYDDED